MSTVLAQVTAALPQIISSIIIAALTWAANQAITWFKTHRAIGSAAQPHAESSAPARPAAPSAPSVWRRINWGQALLQIGILQLVVNAEGVIVGSVVAAFSHSLLEYQQTFGYIQFPLGTLAAAVMFMIFALRVARPILWPHLTVVAAGTVILTLLVNSTLAHVALFLSPFYVVVALIQVAVAMGLGGWVAILLRPQRPAYAPVAATPGYTSGYTLPEPAAPPVAPPAPSHIPWPGAPLSAPPPAWPPRQP